MWWETERDDKHISGRPKTKLKELRKVIDGYSESMSKKVRKIAWAPSSSTMLTLDVLYM
jgi:hypothetical protein